MQNLRRVRIFKYATAESFIFSEVSAQKMLNFGGGAGFRPQVHVRLLRREFIAISPKPKPENIAKTNYGKNFNK
jgi:hypothetical protein